MSEFTEKAHELRLKNADSCLIVAHFQLEESNQDASDSCFQFKCENPILKATNDRLRGLTHDLVYRQLDDYSFDIILPFKDPSASANLLAYLRQSFDYDGIIFEPNFRAGICLWEINKSLSQCIGFARTACYQQQTKDIKRVNIFDIESNEITNKKKLRQTEIIEAIRAKRIKLHLQPKVDIKISQIVAFEALSRWIKEDDSIIYPMDFLPAIAGTDLERLMGYYVVERAIETIINLNEKNIFLPVNINISPRQLSDMRFAEFLMESLRKNNLRNDSIGIEILENETFVQLDQARCILNEYSSACIGIALDDFGTGYASLSYLVDLPINEVKLDRHLIVRAMTHGNYQSLIKAIVTLSKELGLKVTAEGIEEIEQHDLISSLGVDYGQGFLYQRPLSCDEIIARYGVQ